MGVFLVTGPSGVGKTEVARAISDILFGGEKFVVTINMSEYQDSMSVTQLKGASAGYVGYGDGGVLTEGVRKRPYTVVILDEVEKAHKDVLNMFYQVFDKGMLRDGEGRDINFRNTVILMTSNLGLDTITALHASGQAQDLDDYRQAILQELTDHFAPALLARCKVVPFLPLDSEVLKRIVFLKLMKLGRRLMERHKLAFAVAPEVVRDIVLLCTVAQSGARNIDTIIDQKLMPEISRQLLSHMAENQVAHPPVHRLGREGRLPLLLLHRRLRHGGGPRARRPPAEEARTRRRKRHPCHRARRRATGTPWRWSAAPRKAPDRPESRGPEGPPAPGHQGAPDLPDRRHMRGPVTGIRPPPVRTIGYPMRVLHDETSELPMASPETSLFSLEIGGHPPETFRVLEFTGIEALSRTTASGSRPWPSTLTSNTKTPSATPRPSGSRARKWHALCDHPLRDDHPFQPGGRERRHRGAELPVRVHHRAPASSSSPSTCAAASSRTRPSRTSSKR